MLRALAARPDFAAQRVDTEYFERHLAELAEEARAFEPEAATVSSDGASVETPEGAVAVPAPITGRLVEICVENDSLVAPGAPIAVLEAMKMEHLVLAERAGRVRLANARAGDHVAAGTPLLFLSEPGAAAIAASALEAEDSDRIRADLQRVRDRWQATRDQARAPAMAKRHALGLRSARENIADLCDPGIRSANTAPSRSRPNARAAASTISSPTRRRMESSRGSAPSTAPCSVLRKRAPPVLAYDATVLAGTQGLRGHEKTDRLIAVADRNRLPLVLFAEGGGGRPGDTDAAIVAGLHLTSFARFAALSGQAPVVGIAAGRCFAGNAALLGCCDAIIATRGSNIGMGGPAMIEGGGLGRFKPEEIGPSDVQAANGVIDALVEDEAEAVACARQYLSYFQGPLASFSCADPRRLRGAVPENRSRVYDMRALMRLLLDTGSVLELRAGFGRGIFTALGRLEGRPIGVIANNPAHLGGAIDVDAADKAARFLQLCNAHALPVLSLVDTPGFMVGPQIEAQAQVRHVCRLFLAAAALRTPFFALVVRKGYGLGAMGMTAGGFHQPDFIAAWPSGEFGAMGLEGAVRLGFRKELDAAPTPEAREGLFRRLLAQHYEAGSAINMATTLEIDAVIDPAESRAWLARGLASTKTRASRGPVIDAW